MAITASALFLCDGSWENPRNGKVHLQGIFTGIRTTRLPTPERLLVVHALLVGQPGESGELMLECLSEAGSPLLRSRGRVQMGDEGKRHVRFTFDAFQFPDAGDYRFVLTCNGSTIGEQTLLVKEIRS